MAFELQKTLRVLERTPSVLDSLLRDLPNDWVFANEGADTWNAFDIVGHLIHGEKTDWIPRMEKILSDQGEKTFEPFDRFAQFEASKGKRLNDLLDEFSALRKYNLEVVKSKNLAQSDFNKTGIHPVFGAVTLGQLLATWAVHDLNHLSQISRVMAKHYKYEVGPWIEFLGILKP
ncbi:MAG: DinB family protein [Cyclobacteriaceae bacterium]|nr:DinB family protein [Cyclobacteriaceae bacterium]